MPPQGPAARRCRARRPPPHEYPAAKDLRASPAEGLAARTADARAAGPWRSGRDQTLPRPARAPPARGRSRECRQTGKGCSTVTTPSSSALPRSSGPRSSGDGVIRTSRGVTGREHLQRLGSHCRLRAIAADEPVNLAVCEHERRIARLCAGRSFGPDDGRPHERACRQRRAWQPAPRARGAPTAAASVRDRQVGPQRPALDGAPHLSWCQGHVRMPHAVRLQRVNHRVDHCGRRTDGGRLADALRADWVVR